MLIVLASLNTSRHRPTIVGRGDRIPNGSKRATARVLLMRTISVQKRLLNTRSPRQHSHQVLCTSQWWSYFVSTSPSRRILPTVSSCGYFLNFSKLPTQPEKKATPRRGWGIDAGVSFVPPLRDFLGRIGRSTTNHAFTTYVVTSGLAKTVDLYTRAAKLSQGSALTI